MTRATRNAAMVRAYGRPVWEHNKPPMSEARRQHHHGPLLPMDDSLPGDGDLAHIGLLICMASAGLTLFTLWSIFG